MRLSTRSQDGSPLEPLELANFLSNPMRPIFELLFFASFDVGSDNSGDRLVDSVILAEAFCQPVALVHGHIPSSRSVIYIIYNDVREAATVTKRCASCSTFYQGVLLQIMGWWGKVGDHLFDRQGSQDRDIRQPLQVAPFRRPDHPAVRALVSALLPQLSGPRRDDGRARPRSGPHHHLSLGPAIRSRAREAL